MAQASASVRGERDLVKEVLQMGAWQDEELVLLAVQSSGFALRCASPRLRDHDDLVTPEPSRAQCPVRSARCAPQVFQAVRDQPMALESETQKGSEKK
eukprot:Skav226764  [mRNA]  locus=scaffold8:118978:119713:+ [translate_table: standard]